MGGTSGTAPSGGSAGALGGSSGASAGGTSSGGTSSGGSSGMASGGSNGAGTAGTAGTAGDAGTAGAATGGAGGAAGGPSGGASGSGNGGGGSGGTAGGGAFACPSGPFGAPLPTNPTVTRVDGVPPAGFGTGSSSNVEGPVWLDGSLYVSHIQEGVQAPPPARILKITDMMVEEYLRDAGTNGLALDPVGNIVGARHTTGDLATLDLANKTFTPRVTQYMSTRFNSPNDIAIRRDGNVYFTDPDYQAPMPRPQSATRVYRVDPQGTLSVVDDARNQPNGITLSADENTLYVAAPDGIFSHTVAADGSVGMGTRMNGLPGSDGMAMDCAGNLYLTDPNERRIVVVSPTGGMLGTISSGIPAGASPTNVAFGGANRQRLYITARGNDPGLWFIDLQVPGFPY